MTWWDLPRKRWPLLIIKPDVVSWHNLFNQTIRSVSPKGESTEGEGVCSSNKNYFSEIWITDLFIQKYMNKNWYFDYLDCRYTDFLCRVFHKRWYFNDDLKLLEYDNPEFEFGVMHSKVFFNRDNWQILQRNKENYSYREPGDVKW